MEKLKVKPVKKIISQQDFINFNEKGYMRIE
jgi:hypothetical protein